jgi:hypothetical protein
MANVDMVGRLNGVEDHAGASVVDRGADLRDLAALTVHVEGQEPARLDLRQRGGVALANILIHLLPEDDNPNERLPVFLACEEARSATHKWDILDVAVPSVGRVRAMRATASGDLIGPSRGSRRRAS